MADEIKVTRQSQAPMQRPEHYQPAMSESRESMQQPASKAPWVILAIIVVLLVAGGLAFRDKIFPQKTADSNTSAYQAVFLTNGQVYFGKLSDLGNRDYVTLTDIYYLQVGPQQGSGTGSSASSTAPQQGVVLVKLGQELHGPVDEMHISKSQILFYENLKEDGTVVKTIIGDKNNSKK